MKKIILLLMLLVGATTANAQFEQGKKYIGASVSGLGLSYSKDSKFTMGLEATAGYFVSECLMLRGWVDYEHRYKVDDISVGAGARYYFDQCGVFLGAGAEYVHYDPKFNSLQIPVEVGYAFFLNQHVTIEPSVYYRMSINDFADRSSVGLRVGFGFYF